MNYCNHYNLLMKKAKARTLFGYSENHHIIPKRLGGSNKPENLVRLTAREHFIAHILLSKMYPTDTGLNLAVAMMSGKKKYSSLDYEIAKKRQAEVMRNRVITEETRRKMSENNGQRGKESSFKGRQHSKEAKDAVARANKGRKVSEETRSKLSVISSKQKLTGGPNLGRKFDENARENMRQSQLKLNKIKRIHNLIALSYQIEF